MFKNKKITKGSQIFLGSISATLSVLSEKGLFGGGVQAHFANKHSSFLRPKFHLKALWQLRELTTFSGDALEHVDCAIHICEKQSVENVVNVVDDDDDHDHDYGNDDVVNAAYDGDDDDDDGANEELVLRDLMTPLPFPKKFEIPPKNPLIPPCGILNECSLGKSIFIQVFSDKHFLLF